MANGSDIQVGMFREDVCSPLVLFFIEREFNWASRDDDRLFLLLAIAAMTVRTVLPYPSRDV